MIRALAASLALALAPSALAADPVAEAAAKSYRIVTTDSTSQVKPGGSGKVVIVIETSADRHVHPQAPLKIRLTATPGLTLAKTELAHPDAVDPKAEGPRFEVPFTAAGAGKQQVTAAVEFYICSDQWCVRQARDVVVPVDVK